MGDLPSGPPIPPVSVCNCMRDFRKMGVCTCRNEQAMTEPRSTDREQAIARVLEGKRYCPPESVTTVELARAIIAADPWTKKVEAMEYVALQYRKDWQKACAEVERLSGVVTEARDHLYTKQDADRVRHMAKQALADTRK